jgi:hypothetical protein
MSKSLFENRPGYIVLWNNGRFLKLQAENGVSKDIIEPGRCNSQILTSVDVVQDGTVRPPHNLSGADRLAVNGSQAVSEDTIPRRTCPLTGLENLSRRQT